MTVEPRDADGEQELAVLKSRNLELEASLRETRETHAARLVAMGLKAEAIKHGMVDLDGLKLIEPGGVSIGEDGEVSGAAAVMARLRRDKPWLFSATNSSSTASVPVNAMTKTKLATEMTLDEWRAARAELLRRR
jgi:hypothetical protein